ASNTVASIIVEVVFCEQVTTLPYDPKRGPQVAQAKSGFSDPPIRPGSRASVGIYEQGITSTVHCRPAGRVDGGGVYPGLDQLPKRTRFPGAFRWGLVGGPRRAIGG